MEVTQKGTVIKLTTPEKFQKLAFISDVHIDSMDCDRKLFVQHLENCKKEDRKICIIGDLFDLMGGRYDPRRSLHGLNTELLRRCQDEDIDYINAVVLDALDVLKPYSDQILFISYGNHETSVKRNNDIDPIYLLITQLNLTCKTNIIRGQYEGWFIVNFKRNQKGSGEYSNKFNVKYHHGYGGLARRSKGVLEHDIDFRNYPSADMIVKGDNHQKIFDPGNKREALDRNDNVIFKDGFALRTGTYAQKTKAGFGWVVQKGFSPVKLGGWAVDLKIRRNGNGAVERDVKVFEL